MAHEQREQREGTLFTLEDFIPDAKDKKEKDKRLAYRQRIAKETFEYLSKPENLERLHRLAQANHARWKEEAEKRPKAPADVLVVNADWGAAVADMARKYGIPPCFLNPANAHGIGGAFLRGHPPVEENFFRRTTAMLHRTPSMSQGAHPEDQKWKQYKAKYTALINGLNPVNKEIDTILYESELAICFRGPEVLNPDGSINEGESYKFLPDDEIFYVREMCLAAEDLRDGKGGLKPFKPEEYKRKITNLFNTALLHKDPNLVLTALGCGVFYNPIEKAAEIFFDTLKQYTVPALLMGEEPPFQHVVFAILSSHEKAPTISAFRNALAEYNAFIADVMQQRQAVQGPPAQADDKKDDEKQVEQAPLEGQVQANRVEGNAEAADVEIGTEAEMKEELPPAAANSPLPPPPPVPADIKAFVDAVRGEKTIRLETDLRYRDKNPDIQRYVLVEGDEALAQRYVAAIQRFLAGKSPFIEKLCVMHHNYKGEGKKYYTFSLTTEQYSILKKVCYPQEEEPVKNVEKKIFLYARFQAILEQEARMVAHIMHAAEADIALVDPQAIQSIMKSIMGKEEKGWSVFFKADPEKELKEELSRFLTAYAKGNPIKVAAVVRLALEYEVGDLPALQACLNKINVASPVSDAGQNNAPPVF